MDLIKKLFIKDYKNTQNEKVRTTYGVVVGIFGIITNFILFICKFTIGFIGNSMSIIADAVNSLSDMSSSIITIFGFKLSSRPADEDHPYGHARYEYLSSLIIALIILLIGLLLLKSSIEKIISNEPTEISVITFVILIISIGLKFFQMLLYKNFGKSIKSESLIVSSIDSRNDIISTIVVAVSSIVIFIFPNIPFSVDGVFGILVSLFIIINSISLLKDTINPLLGERPNPELVKAIKDFIISYDGVYGVHDLMVHNYGAKVNFTTVHVEVSRNVDVMESHELIDKIEMDFRNHFDGVLTIHIDPIEIDNPEIIDLKYSVKNILKVINPYLDFHDFRMVKGSKITNLIFDIVIPYSVKDVSKDFIISELKRKLNNDGMQYNFIISIDRE